MIRSYHSVNFNNGSSPCLQASSVLDGIGGLADTVSAALAAADGQLSKHCMESEDFFVFARESWDP